jgi:hypothetical protein
MPLKPSAKAKEKLFRICKLAKDLGEHFADKKLDANEEYTVEITILKAVEQEFRRGLSKRYKIKN